MCKNAEATVASLMGAIEPSLINLLTLLNVASTPAGQAAINAYNVALQAVRNWVPGSSAADVIEVINAFTQAFDVVVNSLPVPAEVKGLVDVISAGIVVVIGVLGGNSPVPVSPAPSVGAASEEELAHAHQSEIAKDTEAKVAALVPSFKRSKFHSIDHQWKGAWNHAVDEATAVDPKYAVLKAA